jgi:hypothetical protein
MKDKIKELETNGTKVSDIYRGIHEFKNGYQPIA